MEGHYWTGETCGVCADMEMSSIFFPIIPMIIMIAAVIILYVCNDDPLDQWESWRNGCAFLGFICLNHYQILYLIRNTNIQFPSDFGALMKAFSFTDDFISIFKVACTGYGNFEQNIIIRALVPIIGAIVVV